MRHLECCSLVVRTTCCIYVPAQNFGFREYIGRLGAFRRAELTRYSEVASVQDGLKMAMSRRLGETIVNQWVNHLFAVSGMRPTFTMHGNAGDKKCPVP